MIRNADKATGVEIKDGSGSSAICIKNGGRVILSAGALQSPQLLMWSGIGDPAQLAAIAKSGLVTVSPQDWINNTAVGDKVFDNPNTFIELHGDTVSSYDYNYASPIQADRDLYLQKRSGPYSFASETSAFWDFIKQGNDMVGCQGTIDSSGFGEFTKNGTITLNVYGTSGLRSTGRVTLDAKGVATPSSNFYQDKRDATAIAIFIFNIFQALPSSLQPLNIAKSSTVEQIQTYITTWSQYTLGNVNHWSSSCRLGSCVDNNAKVIGMNNLFVVDASIVAPLTTNPVMGIMIAAERAVERILAL